jgi:hypothetical protein
MVLCKPTHCSSEPRSWWSKLSQGPCRLTPVQWTSQEWPCRAVSTLLGGEIKTSSSRKASIGRVAWRSTSRPTLDTLVGRAGADPETLHRMDLTLKVVSEPRRGETNPGFAPSPSSHHLASHLARLLAGPCHPLPPLSLLVTPFGVFVTPAHHHFALRAAQLVRPWQ